MQWLGQRGGIGMCIDRTCIELIVARLHVHGRKWVCMFYFCFELNENLKQIEVITQQSTPCSAKSPYQDSTLSPNKQKSRFFFRNSKANGSPPLSLSHHRTIAIISLARLPTTASLPSSPSTLLAKLQHYSTLATTKSLPF